MLVTTACIPFQCNNTLASVILFNYTLQYCWDSSLFEYCKQKTKILYIKLCVIPSNFMNQMISEYPFISCHHQQNSIGIALSFSPHSSLEDGRVKITLQCWQKVYTAYSVLLRFQRCLNFPLANSSVKTMYCYIQLSCQKSYSFYPCFTFWPQTLSLSKVLKVCQAVMHYPWCWRLPFHDSVTY